jgi:hypothetical protein
VISLVGRWRVRVCLDDYGRVGVVVLTRSCWSRFYQHGLEVARIRLSADDAEQQIADAKAKARAMARELRDVESIA